MLRQVSSRLGSPTRWKERRTSGLGEAIRKYGSKSSLPKTGAGAGARSRPHADIRSVPRSATAAGQGSFRSRRVPVEECLVIAKHSGFVDGPAQLLGDSSRRGVLRVFYQADDVLHAEGAERLSCRASQAASVMCWNPSARARSPSLPRSPGNPNGNQTPVLPMNSPHEAFTSMAHCSVAARAPTCRRASPCAATRPRASGALYRRR